MNSIKYCCEKCDYHTNHNNDYKKHCKSKKHNNEQTIEQKFECKICNKKYKSNQGLWAHNKICKEVKIYFSNELMNTIIIQNKEITVQNKEITVQNKEQNEEIKELKNMIIQLLKNQPIPITNNNLNLNFFLNEQCKNAINMIDFIKSIVFELKDFENIQDKGYIENKTNIILENLNKLTVYERPLHYVNSDENKTIHIKDENQWKKETEENKPILENALKELDNNEYDDLYKTIKVTGVSHRGKKTVDYDVNKFPNFSEVKEILEKEDNEETKKFIISSILENVVYPK